MNIFPRARGLALGLLAALPLTVFATSLAGANGDVEAVGQLLDQIEEAWTSHDLAALEKNVAEQGFLALASRPGDPAGPWVGRKAETIAMVGKLWSKVVRHEFVEREISIHGNAAFMRLGIADKLADGQRRFGRTWQIAVKEGDAWRMCFVMPEIASIVGIVEDVLSDSVAGRAGIREGDMVLGCDQRGVVDDTLFGGATSEGPRTLVVRRGENQLRIETESGPLGTRLALRLLPGEGSRLVEVDESHPIKELWLDAIRGYLVGDHGRAAKMRCPAGFLMIGPSDAQRAAVLSGDAETRRAEAERQWLLSRYELATATFSDQRAIVCGDLALATARLTLDPREPGTQKISEPMDVMVFVKQGDQWRAAASLPLRAGAGLSADEPGVKIDPAEVQSRVSGKLVGIGAGLELAANGVKINRIMPDSPAEQAGLKVGTIITAVDGQSVAGLTLEDVVRLIRGPEGSKVSLSLRLSDGSTKTLDLTRAEFAANPVQSRRLADGIVWMRIPAFNQKTLDDCRPLLLEFVARDPRGLVLDLRGCTGGTPQATKAVAGMVLPQGSPLWGIRMGQQPIVKVVAGGGKAIVPESAAMVVLIDKDTQSAGVLLAYALKENGRARLLGHETAAMNSMRKLVTGRGGQGRLVKCGEFFSVDDEPLTDQRVKPDVTIADDASEEAWLRQALQILDAKASNEKSEKNVPRGRPRTWTDTTGKYKTEAEYLGVEDGKVRLRKTDGTVVEIPLEKLSPADRKFVEENG
ncbi:MAG: PDZ domain-containing protein [Pirellulales bacterium]|nr:PDZ domain-containing protein [Pirellulales bacterium]